MSNRPGLVTGSIRYQGQVIGSRQVSQTGDSFAEATQIAFVSLPDCPQASYVWVIPAGGDVYEVVGYYDKINYQNVEV